MNWDQQLREQGIRITPQRQLVIEAITRMRHADAEAILRDVQRVSSVINLSTVYRALETLEDAGIIAHTHLGHGSPSYFVIDESEHIHLVCDACGESFCVGAAVANDLGARLFADSGFEVDMGHLSIHGLCQACANQARFIEAREIS